eukprot:NODE_5433_length_700_cov_1.195462_g5410_i0.p3 GENE.NODE_5433_length_700_cov_1.195462_g5410_i0~~NODE_5433_length_700_cov_1.195462_g5410_i0.p3  ORF type:complete len:121 (+),score=38.00 NODE_5433_length_700_cov_1.195462_g5410_i0:320-682(+)
MRINAAMFVMVIFVTVMGVRGVIVVMITCFFGVVMMMVFVMIIMSMLIVVIMVAVRVIIMFVMVMVIMFGMIFIVIAMLVGFPCATIAHFTKRHAFDGDQFKLMAGFGKCLQRFLQETFQ